MGIINFKFSDLHKQQLLIAVAVLICIASIFGVILFLSYFGEDPSVEGFPSPSPGAFNNLTSQNNQNSKVQGVSTQQNLDPNFPLGPDIPSPKPSPSPSPSPSFSPSPSPS